MQESADTSKQKTDNTSAYGVYRHRKCSQWGLGTMVWERDGKRAFKFEDGEERIIAEPFYHLMEKVADAAPPDARGESAITPNIDDQLALFLDLFPGGFAGDAWKSTHRGGSGRRLKRHRQPAVDEAAQKLSPEALDELIAAGEHEAVRDRICDVIGNTDLVTKKHVDQLRAAMMSASVAQALRDFLHGDASEAERFSNLRRELGHAGLRSPAWNLLTGILSLAQPQKHVCIRPSVFEQQAKLMRPAFSSRSRPSWNEYSRFLEIAHEVRDALAERGQPPADMLDVYDFIWVTLRPAEKEKLEGIAAARPAREAAAAASASSDKDKDQDKDDDEDAAA